MRLFVKLLNKAQDNSDKVVLVIFTLMCATLFFSFNGHRSLHKFYQSLFIKPLPRIDIAIKHKNFLTLSYLRNEALKNKTITKNEKRWFNAYIKDENQDLLDVKLRLKGDWIDHIKDEKKWSLRVRVKGGKTFNGFREFSINNPETRNFFGEYFGSKLMRKNQVMSPRSGFYNVFVNGYNIGAMYLEEFFSTEMLEDQSRKESAILRFDEEVFWDCARLNIKCRFDYDNTVITAIDGSDKNIDNYIKAVSLIRALSEEQLKIEEVFDIENLLTYLSVLVNLKTYHGLSWINSRLYYNPINSKLEVISYDNNISFSAPQPLSNWGNDSWLVRMVSKDKEIYKRFVNRAIEVSDKIADINIVNNINHSEFLKSVELEYGRKMSIDLRKIRMHALEVKNYFQNIKNNYDKLYIQKGDYTKIVPSEFLNDKRHILIANHVVNQKYPFLEITRKFGFNVDKTNILITKVYIKHNKKIQDLAIKKKLPINLKVDNLLVKFSEPNLDKYTIYVEANFPDSNEIVTYKANKNYALAVDKNYIPTFKNIKQKFLYQKGNKIFVKRGSWVVQDNIIIPKNHEFIIGPGTSLLFKKDKSIISHSPIRIVGTKESPIKLSGYNNEYWRGLAVLEAKEKSMIEHTNISNVAHISYGQWSLSGAINFYKSEVEFKNVNLDDSSCEDAINIINSKFSISNLSINNAVSDALDLDFSQGYIKNSSFKNVGFRGGGDAIDLSGSSVEISNSTFDKVLDKAISIGESSRAVVNKIKIMNSSFGLVTKDGSYLDASDVEFSNIVHVAIMSYQKKPQYQSARINVKNVKFINVQSHFSSQKGSEIIFNGKKLQNDNIDVKKLYNNQMKKPK